MEWTLLLLIPLVLILVASVLGRRQLDERPLEDGGRRRFLRTMLVGTGAAAGVVAGVVPIDAIAKGFERWQGAAWTRAGYVYVPYVPLFTMPSFMDPSEAVVRRGAMSRYAKEMVNPDYYVRVTFKDDDPDVVDEMVRDFDAELEKLKVWDEYVEAPRNDWGPLVSEGDTQEKRDLVQTMLDNQLAELKRRTS